MKYIALILTTVLMSCSYNTDISYRIDKDDEYIRDDGFMISCRKDGNFLTVGTYTPSSWGKEFYYGYLTGKKTDRQLKITSLDLLFLDTSDTLTLHEIQKERDYFYTSPNLEKIIDTNKKLKITVYITDIATGKNERKEFILTRTKNTYHTGTAPHT